MPLINFSGIASGIDTEGLIDATSDVTRQTRVQPKEDKISELQDTNTALEELESRLSTLKTLARGFGTLGGGIVSKLGSSTDETIATAVANRTAANGTYNFTVNQLAKNGTLSLASTLGSYSSADDIVNSNINNGAAAGDRTVSITTGILGFAEQVDVVLTDTTTLSQFVDSYNDSATKSQASVVNVGTDILPDYRVLIVSNKPGVQEGRITVTDVGNEIDENPGIGNAAFDTNTNSDALNAEFTMDGISGTIVRQSNTVSDLISGVTFNLEGTGTAQITIETDETQTLASAQEFIDAYNDIVEFINDNNLVVREEDGEDVENIFGPLAKTSLDDNSLSSVKTAMSNAALDDINLAYTIFASIGITTERDGTLALDEEDFETALADETDSVNQLFLNLGDDIGATNGTIDQYIQFNGLFDTTVNSNKELISDLNDDIARAEAFIARTEESMRARFARLEATIGQLQSQQTSLAGILGSLPSGG